MFARLLQNAVQAQSQCHLVLDSVDTEHLSEKALEAQKMLTQLYQVC